MGKMFIHMLSREQNNDLSYTCVLLKIVVFVRVNNPLSSLNILQEVLKLIRNFNSCQAVNCVLTNL